MNANTVKIIIGIVLIILIALCLYKIKSSKENKNINNLELIEKDSIINNNKNTIDSLIIKIDKLNNSNNELKDSLKKKDTIRIITIEELKRLPLDSTVNLLKQKLEEYETKY